MGVSSIMNMNIYTSIDVKNNTTFVYVCVIRWLFLSNPKMNEPINDWLNDNISVCHFFRFESFKSPMRQKKYTFKTTAIEYECIS